MKVTSLTLKYSWLSWSNKTEQKSIELNQTQSSIIELELLGEFGVSSINRTRKFDYRT